MRTWEVTCIEKRKRIVNIEADTAEEATDEAIEDNLIPISVREKIMITYSLEYAISVAESRGTAGFNAWIEVSGENLNEAIERGLKILKEKYEPRDYTVNPTYGWKRL